MPIKPIFEKWRTIKVPDWLIKKQTSSRNIGVCLSKKSLANSTMTGNSVSSSSSWRVYEKYNNFIINRSSHQRCSTKKRFLKISQYSQESTLVGVSFKVLAFRTATLFKRDSKCRCLPVQIAKFLRTSILKNFCERQNKLHITFIFYF